MSEQSYRQAREIILNRLPLDSYEYWGPNTADDVAALEEALGWQLPPTYRQFLLDFGSLAMNGDDIFGLFWQDGCLHFEALEQSQSYSVLLEKPGGMLLIWLLGVDYASYWLDLTKSQDGNEAPVLQLGYFPSDGISLAYDDFGDCLLSFAREALKEEGESPR